MRAVVVSRPGGPEVLELVERPIPDSTPGEVTIRVRAFGLNRAELLSRQGDSGSAVPFPRIIGIECVGEVVAAPGTDLHPGQTVAAMMGGMGRRFDGSYAEYTRIPRPSVFPLETSLDWATLGALPEMFQTCNGSLVTGLRVAPGQSLLIRGGTSSIGLTTAALAKQRGLRVLSTTRNPAKRKARGRGCRPSDRRPRRFSGRGRARGRPWGRRTGARARRHDHLGGLVALCQARWHRVHDR